MKPEDVIVAGPLRTIAHARDARGRAHARAFLDIECPRKDHSRLHHWFDVIAHMGERASNREGFRHEAGPIHAFKSAEARVATFRVANTWLLTHGFIKKRDRWRAAEIRRAERIRAEHMAREGM